MLQNRRAPVVTLASLAFVAHAVTALAGIVPADRATVWNPGIPGGIPTDADATRPATLWLPSGNPYGGYSVDPALGNDSTDATSAINNAISSAGAAATASGRKIVLLAPGTYRTNGIINVSRSYVTLRGSGAGQTIIDHRATSDYAAIDIGRTVGDFSTTPVVNVVGGAAKGAAQITVADASGFAVGDILQIDQLADGTANGPTGWVWWLDSWWSLRSPYADFSGGGGLQGKFPDSPNGYRPISQRIEVLAKSGNTLTIYDPATGRGAPLHVAFPATMDPEVWRAAGGTTDVVRYTGLEGLSVWSAAASGDAKDMVLMNGAAYSWIKNIETDGAKNTWAGRHIHLQNAVYRAEVRGSYSHNSSNYNQGANAYGIIYSGSECLIEDNIVRELNKPVVGETTGGGNVIAYNYVDEAIISSLTNSWQETAINMSHGSFSHSDLFEGNYAPNIGVDSTHGNNGFGVIFRNYVTGRNSSGGTDTYQRAIYSDGWSREMTSIGNVLGGPSFNPTYQLLTPSTGVNPVYGGVSSIYLLGSNAFELGTGNKPGADHMDNGQAASLFYRHLDWDKKTNSQYVNPANPVTTLPDSLYLTSKPAFFGDLPWPWVDPGGTTKVYTLPAKARYDATATPGTFALTVTKAGSGGGTVTSSPAGISCGAACSASYASGTVVTLSQSAASGSTFAGWSGACTGAGACQVTMSAARAVTATFTGTATTYTLTVTKAGTGAGTVTSSPAGISCGAACSASYASGTVVTLSQTPAAGSTFAGWSGACSGTGACQVTMTAARAVTATFASANPTLTVARTGTGTGTISSSPAGISCGSTCSASYTAGTVVNLYRSASLGSVFVGWGGACTGAGACQVTMDAAKTVTATFNLVSYTLSVAKTGTGAGTIVSSPAGISCGASCNARFDTGTVVTLSPTPAAGSGFAGWSGACTGTGTCQLTMAGDRGVVATFTLAPQVTSIKPVSGPATGGTTVTIRGSRFVAGTTVSVGGVPATGVVVEGATRLTAVTGAHLGGLVDVVVTVPGSSPATLARGFFYSPPPQPSDFYTLPPCRLVDTRHAQAPALAARERRVWTLTGRCGLPATAVAVAVNVTVTGASAPGYIALAPGDGLSDASALNFVPNRARANFTMVMLATDGSGRLAATNQSSGAVQLILDVTGYFE